MFNLLKNSLVLEQYSKTLENKCLNVTSNIDYRQHTKYVCRQIELLKFLNKEYSDQTNFLFKQLSTHFAKHSALDIKVDSTQKELIQQFIDSDLKNILDECIILKNILTAELKVLENKSPDDYKKLLNQENTQLTKIKNSINKDGELERTFSSAYNSAKNIDYSKIISKIKHSLLRLKSQFAIEKPAGLENIPLSGPVIIAPRHYEAGVDAAALFASIPRRTFILVGVDWVQTGAKNFLSKVLYFGLGAIKINRQKRPDSDVKLKNSPYYEVGASTKDAIRQIVFLLQSGESIIIFPEGWANEGRTQGHIDKPNGVLPAQDGFMAATEFAQRSLNQKIPIIPTGIMIDHNKKTMRIIFGKPMYYLNTNKEGYRKAFGEEIMSEIKKLSGL